VADSRPFLLTWDIDRSYNSVKTAHTGRQRAVMSVVVLTATMSAENVDPCVAGTSKLHCDYYDAVHVFWCC